MILHELSEAFINILEKSILSNVEHFIRDILICNKKLVEALIYRGMNKEVSEIIRIIKCYATCGTRKKKIVIRETFFYYGIIKH